MDSDSQAQAGDDSSQHEPTLLRLLVVQRHWQKFAVFESQFRRAAGRLALNEGESHLRNVTVSRRQFERWYSGNVKTEPYPDACRVLEHMFGHPVRRLLAPPSGGARFTGISGALASIRRQATLVMPADGSLESASCPPASSYDLAAGSDWPIWFGVHLAQLIALVDNWQGSIAELNYLQTLLHQEILMFDSAAPETGDSLRAVHALSRRQALATIAALPLALATSSRMSAGGSAAATDLFVTRCAASLTACWHLLRGSDLLTVDQTISSYLLALEGVAQQPSKYQLAAARLASQAHRIRGIVALHCDQLQVRERHCKRALYYATVADDASSQAAALISLASTHFYNSESTQAVIVYERAFALGPDLSELQRSRVHAELSVVYGQLRRDNDAIRSADQAEGLYPDYPEQDRSFLYAEFTPASLHLERGLAYIALAEHYPDRGYQRIAADIFSDAHDDDTSAVPDRIRFEIINHQARAAALLRDLDALEGYINRGIEGIVLLGSKQRHREIKEVLKQATETWPRERQIRSLSERLALTADVSSKDLS